MTELHDPSRALNLKSAEIHLNATARLSRALWELFEHADFSDERTIQALRQLADDIADNSSAALFQFNAGEKL